MKNALLLSVATGVLGLSAHVRAESGLVVTHHELLETFEIASRAGVALGQQKAGLSTTTLRFDALGRRYELELEPNTRLLPGSAMAALRPGLAVYRGKVVGVDGSWARIVVADGVPGGVIWDGGEMLAIERPGDSAVATTSPVIYRLKDTYIVPGTMSCGTDTSGGSGAAAYHKLVGELETAMAQSAAADLQLDLGVVGDFELFQRYGSNRATAEGAILTRLNTVDGIYSEQLGVQLRVEQLDLFTTANDPFSDETDAEILLDEVGDYRQDTPAQQAQGLTHLYTARNLATQTVGIAYLDALCRPFFGVGLTEDSAGTGALTASLITAHEIGHNFGAEHDAEADSVCEDTPPTFLMAATVNGSDQFSQCSVNTITPNIAAASCITAAPTIDLTIGIDGSPSALLGADVSLAVAASNSGTQSATGVQIDIDLPDNMTFQSAATEFGTCTSGAGSVNCTYGTVPGGGQRAVTVTSTATDVGDGTFTATVSADTDVDPGNNEESLTVTVDPAVDLVVNSLAAAQTEVNQSVSIGLDLENRSILGATGVEVSVTLGSGIRAASASWTLGTCTVTDQQIDCTTDDFAAQSDATLNLTLTGVSNGASSYTVSLSSTEADANTSNNSTTATVQVGPVTMSGGSGSSSGGGGGSSAPVSLLLLAACAAMARTRRRLEACID